MIQILVIAVIACVASLLTFFSGFGLGTILTAALSIYFDLPVAVAITAIVHLLNNIFKLGLIGKAADKNIVIKFGIPALFAAILGALCLKLFSNLSPLHSYYLLHKKCDVTVLKIIVGLIMIFITLLEWIPKWKSKAFDPKYLHWGGILSGFFGGLSGHQGAFRSMFLVNQKLDKTAFVATGVVIACIIDVSRLPIYFTSLDKVKLGDHMTLILAAILSAFLGAFVGSKMIDKITNEVIQYIVAVMIIIIALLMISGVV